MNSSEKQITSESVCSLFEEIGFEVENSSGRIINGFRRIQGDEKHMFYLQVSVESKVFWLTCSSTLIREMIIKQQGFDCVDEMKQVLLKNRVLTRCHPDTG